MSKASTGLVIAALSLGMLAGCGDDDDPTAGDTDSITATGPVTTAAGGEGETVKISETDFAIDPNVVDVPAGTVTFEVTNDGDTLHNLEIESDSFEEELSADLEPGDSGTLTVDLAEGTYEMYCPVADHADLGMVGEVTVGSARAGGGATTTEDESESESEDEESSGGSVY